MAYQISCVKELIKRQIGRFDIEFEDGKYKIEDLETQYMQIYNGKYGGGRIMLNPMGMINDGLMEFCFRRGHVNAMFAIYLFLQPGGRMCYDPGFNIYRCKKAKVINKMKDSNGNLIP